MWHSHVGSNPQFNWTYGLLNTRENKLPGTSEITNRESALPSLCQTSIILNYILNLYLYPQADVPITTPHQGRLTLQQMDTITENHTWPQCSDQWIVGSPVTMDTSIPQLLHLLACEHCRKGGRKKCKNQDTKISGMKESLIEIVT